MYLQPDIKFQQRLVQCAKYFVSAIATIPVLVLVGWEFNIDRLTRPFPNLGAMNPISAILFILAALSLASLTSKKSTRKALLFGKTLAWFILLIAGYKLVTFLTNPGFTIDDILYYKKITAEAYHPVSKSMAPATAACFILTAVALLLLKVKATAKKLPAQYIAIIILLAASFSVIGYLYQIRSLHSFRYYNPIAFYSSICFILIGLVILFAYPARGIMKQFTSIHTGSITARFLIPTALLIPFIFGLILYYGSWFELYTPESRIVLFVLAVIVIFFVALWYNTIFLNKRDLQKAETEKALKESQEQVQAIFRSAPAAVIVFDEEGRGLQWNKQAESIFGWTMQEVCYERIFNFIIPHRYRKTYMRALQYFIKTGKSEIVDTSLELRGLRKDNTEIDISLSISPTMLKNKYLFVGFIQDITEKKRTEEQLKQFNKLLEKEVKEKTAEITGIFERITDAFIAVDKKFCYTYINKKAGELIKRDPASLIGKCIWDIFPDVAGSDTYTAFHQAMNEQCYVVNTDYYEPLDLWQENHIYPSPEGLSVFIKDISARKRAEKDIKERAIQLHAISNNLPGIMTYQVLREHDGTKRFTYVSEIVEKLTGRTSEEVMKDPQILYNLVHEDDKYKISKAEEKSYQAMSLLDIIIRSMDAFGETRWLHIRSVPRKIADGRVVWDGVYIDITESMEREKQLAEKETQLRLFVENSPAAIAMLDKDMKYIIASKRWSVDYNLEHRNIIGKSHYEIFPEIPQQWKDIHQRCLAGAIEKNEEDLFIRIDGNEEWVRWEIHPWYLISGEVGGIILLTEVITDRKKAALALKESEELLKRSYGDIRRLASHLEKIREEERISIAREIHDELGQQLTVLKMDISWLNKNIFITEEKAVQRMSDLREMIDQTIKTVRRISSELRPSVLDDLGLLPALEWLSNDFEKRSGIKTKFIAEISEPNLDAGVNTALFRIFQESLTNVARHAEATEVSAFLKKENEKLLITIKDNGKGFAISSIENKKTLGILGIRERVALLHGEYDIVSFPGQGSIVKVMVPVSSITEPKTSQ